MDESRVSFGAWVARLRRAQDLTQQELAVKIGCSVSALRKIESDERRPSREIATLLAQALGVPADQLPLFLRVARRELMVERLPAPEVLASATLDLPHGPPNPQPVSPLLLSQPPSPAANAGAPLPVARLEPPPLPVSSTPLVGRDPELATLLGLLHDPACRLVTLVGAGGIGKSRLALQAALALRDSAGLPVYFVSLTSLQEADHLSAILAAAVGAPLEGARDPDHALAAWLAPHTLVLVLDNMEHLLPGADLLAWLLTQAPGLKLLVTSLERLDLHNEWVLELQGLAVPPASRNQTPASDARATDYSAVQLFLQSAQRARVGFDPSNADLEAITRICRMVEGLPLAIELAAGWVRILGCAEIADEIERDLHFLASQARDLPARHRSIATLFDRSWRLLDEREQQALCRLSVFRAGFTREIAASVAGASLPVISSLVARSLVRRSSELRYDLHELVRQFAYEQLRASGAAPEVERALVSAMRSLAVAARAEMTGPNQTEWLDRVAVELNNLRAAMDWCAEHGEVTLGLEICASLSGYWYQRDAHREGVRRLRELLDAAEHLPGAPADSRPAGTEPLTPHAYVDALGVYSYLAYELGDFGGARMQLAQGLAIIQEAPNAQLEGSLLNNLGQVLAAMGDLQGARAVLERALALAANDQYAHRRRALALLSLADVNALAGDHEGAQYLYAASSAVWREGGDSNALAYALRKWAWSAIQSGDLDDAEQLVVESLHLNLGTASQLGILACVACLAALRLAQGHDELGARLLFAVDQLLESASIRLRPVDHLGHTATLAATRARLDDVTRVRISAQIRSWSTDQLVEEALRSTE